MRTMECAFIHLITYTTLQSICCSAVIPRSIYSLTMTKQSKTMGLKRQMAERILKKNEQSSFFSPWHQCKCRRDRGGALQHWTSLTILLQDRKHCTFRIFHCLSSSSTIAAIADDILIPYDTYLQIPVNFTYLSKAGLYALDLAKSHTILFLRALGHGRDRHYSFLLQELFSLLKFMALHMEKVNIPCFPCHGGSLPRPTPSTGV